jgi:large repetitive protein
LSINAGAVAAASYSATGLPPGMSISAVTGLISGTPTTVGFYQVSVQATGPGGTSTLNFSVNVTLLTAPHFGYIPNPIAGLVGVPFTMAFPATDNGTDTITYQVDTLPAGLSLQPNGVISGTPTSAGTTQSQLQAQGLAGSATASLSFSITIPVPTGTSSAPGGPGTGSAPGESGATSGTSGGCGLGVGVALLSLAGIFGFMRLRRDDGPGSSRA